MQFMRQVPAEDNGISGVTDPAPPVAEGARVSAVYISVVRYGWWNSLNGLNSGILPMPFTAFFTASPVADT